MDHCVVAVFPGWEGAATETGEKLVRVLVSVGVGWRLVLRRWPETHETW